MPQCDQPAWVFLHLSMAGWNTVASVILTALMAVILVVVVALPEVGLWALLLLLVSRPLERLARSRRDR